MNQLLIKIIYSFFLILLFYYFYKKLMMILAKKLVKKFKLSIYFPFSDIKGAIELMLIAVSHVCFCFFLLKIFHIEVNQLYLSFSKLIFFLVAGFMTGIGCMGVSAMLCQLLFLLVKSFKSLINIFSDKKLKSDLSMKTWLTLGRGGWIKHHLQSIEIFPIYISIFILLLQVGSEEFIFRLIFYQHFINYGVLQAACLSIFFFVIMQAFLMNRFEAALFPMIGALVMGVVHTILFINIPLIWPLVISHLSFFLFSII